MTTLHDPFAVTHTKTVRTKSGEQHLTYIQWTDAADRLDECEPGWSFAILDKGPDWVHGRLTLSDGRYTENIGYAENADQDWKKEVLKDAASDALKRCAALMGVGRYLYDRVEPHNGQAGHSSPAPAHRPAAAGNPRPAAPVVPVAAGAPTCPVHRWEMRRGKKGGWFCSGKLDGGEWCDQRLTDEEAADLAAPAPAARRDDLDDLPF